MRGKTLAELLSDYRSEARLSQNPAHNAQVRDSQVKLLQKHQERLWEDYNWPHLRVRIDVQAQEGQRYYDPPATLKIDRIERIEFRDGGEWQLLAQGVDAAHYAVNDSDLDVRSWPISRWQIYEDEQVEVWPILDQDGDEDTLEGYLRYTGIRSLNALVEDTDAADLDSVLIVLYAAAETLAASGAKDAEMKLRMAERRYTKLVGNQAPRRRVKMFGGEVGRVRRPFVTYRAPT